MPPISAYSMQILYFVSFLYVHRAGPLPPQPEGGFYLADDLLRVHSSEVSACRAGFNDVGGEMLSDLFDTVPLLETMWRRRVVVLLKSRVR